MRGELERTRQCQCTQGEAKVKHEVRLAAHEAGDNVKETKPPATCKIETKSKCWPWNPKLPEQRYPKICRFQSKGASSQGDNGV